MEVEKSKIPAENKNSNRTYEGIMSSPISHPIQSQGIEVCFVMDATGSMSSYIELVKKSLIQIATLINEMADEEETRIATVVYRDYCDGDRSLEMTDFVNIHEDNIKSNAIVSHLKKIKCFGGGDAPEDVRGGFYKALYELSWKAKDRFIILVADAPCHGKIYHDSGDGDSCPDEVIDETLWIMMRENITLLGLDFVETGTKIMYDEFAKIFLNKGYSRLFDRENMKDVCGNADEKFPLFCEKIYVAIKRCFDRKKANNAMQAESK